MLLNLTYQELERIECDIKAHIKNKTRIEQENKTIKLEKEDIQVPMNFFMILFFALFYCYCWILDKIELVHIGICIFLILFFAWFNSPTSTNSSSNKETNPSKDSSNEDIKFSDEEMKAEMLRRLKAQYFCESNINFLNFLYHKEILLRAEKERIDDFLASKGKGILDYLSSLGEKELEMFAKPYKKQIAIDIEQVVHDYYKNKSKQEKSLLELVKAQA